MEAHTTTALERRQIAAAKEATLNSVSLGVLGLRGKYLPADPRTPEAGTGNVHLYRDTIRSPDPGPHKAGSDVARDDEAASDSRLEEAYVDKDHTTLCILAVPTYMTPSDLLGWFGEATLELVSNVRLVKTSKSNRYMVLIKFRNTWSARQKQKEWNGKAFSDKEPQTCHVVFIKSIRSEAPAAKRDHASFPHMHNDPFVPSLAQTSLHSRATSSSEDKVHPTTSLTSKTAAAPILVLAELPTCPVCLERMDDTTGLATIFCQHVFHCECLQKWRGSGCPVCRHTQEDILSRSYSGTEDDECRVCGLTENLWICLICGQLGCGRYDDAHAFAHFQQTCHAFAMDVKTQAIWDYINDDWVHRLIQNKANDHTMDPSTASKKPEADEDGKNSISKETLEDMSFEYASMLKVQLDSQRGYFQEQVDRAVDKVAQATAAADHATATSLKSTERLEAMEASHQILLNETLPGLEREKDRAERRAEKFEALARKMEKEWKEKEVINDSLMDRIAHVEKQLNEATLKSSEVEEQNRDLSFFISGMEKLRDQGEDVQEGTLEIAEAPKQGKKKKGKNKK